MAVGGLKELGSSLWVGIGGVSDFSVGGTRGGYSFKMGVLDWGKMG